MPTAPKDVNEKDGLLSADHLLHIYKQVYEESDDHRMKMLAVLHHHAAGNIGPKTAMKRLQKIIHDHDLTVSELQDIANHHKSMMKESLLQELPEYVDTDEWKKRGIWAASGAAAYHVLAHGWHKPVLKAIGSGAEWTKKGAEWLANVGP